MCTLTLADTVSMVHVGKCMYQDIDINEEFALVNMDRFLRFQAFKDYEPFKNVTANFNVETYFPNPSNKFAQLNVVVSERRSCKDMNVILNGCVRFKNLKHHISMDLDFGILGIIQRIGI